MAKRRFAFSSLGYRKKEKLSNLILDIVKYMITVELAALMFGNIQEWGWQSYMVSIFSILSLLVLGFKLLDDKDAVTDDTKIDN